MNSNEVTIMKKLLIMLAVGLIATAILGAMVSWANEMGHGGDVLYTEPVKAVLFSHKTHVEDMGFGCDSCHAGLFEMASLSAQANKDFNMEGLYAGKYCGACHNGSMAFASNTQCATCHIGVKGYNKIANPEGAKSEGKH